MKFAITILLVFISFFLISTENIEIEDHFYLSDEDPHDIPNNLIRSTVQGTITDSNIVPMADVCVLFIGNNNVLYDYTDENGEYEFSGVSTGTSYTILPCKYEIIETIDNSIVSGDSIITIARSELGNTDGSSPGNYHGHGGGWCSEFVSWCYWQANDPFTGGTTDGGACVQYWNMSTVHRVNAGFGRNEDWQVMAIQEINENWTEEENNPLEPQAGDYVFFSNTNGINRAHSGLVRYIDGTTMSTTEGNVSNLVCDVTRSNWRTYQDGNTIVKGIGYRRKISNVSFEPRFWYGYIYSNLTADFTLYHFQPGVPQNISILIDGNNIELSWDESGNADSYSVYSSNNPYSDFDLDETGTFDGTNWTTIITDEIKFYRITANN